jgi:hypothetical protein
MVFLEGSAPALPKIFGASGNAPSSFSACFGRLHICSHQLQVAVQMVWALDRPIGFTEKFVLPNAELGSLNVL